MPLNLPPTPFKDPIAERDSLAMSRGFFSWLLPFLTRVQAASSALVALVLSAQTASLPVTALLAIASTARYRVTVYARVTTAAGTNSSLIPTISHTDSGVACTQSGDAFTANATNVSKSWTFEVKADASTPISLSTTYVSVGVPAMVYTIDTVVESLS